MRSSKYSFALIVVEAMMRLTVKNVGAVWCAQTLAKAETRQRINVFTRHAKGVIISTLHTVILEALAVLKSA